MTYQPLIIGVVCTAGSVGKSTLAAHLLAAFRPSAKLITVDSVNNNEAANIASLNVEELMASQFDDIYREIMEGDDLILDIGASNIEVFLDGLGRYRSAIGYFDLFVIPAVPGGKQQKDVITTIDLLHELGFSGEKIRVVFNQHHGSETIDHAYAHIFGYALKDGKNKARWDLPAPIVHANEIFELIKETDKTVSELATNTTNWKELRNQAKRDGDREALDLAIDGQIAHDLACSAYENLQQAYADLLAPYQEQSKAGK